MSTLSPAPGRPRIALFGMHCGFTEAARESLSAGCLAPHLLMLAGQPFGHSGSPTIPLIRASSRSSTDAGSPESPASTAPVYAYSADTRRIREILRHHRIDGIVVACFPHLIPAAIIHSVSFALNIHPSLLPRHRGPDPVFWTLRAGEDPGITVHALDEHFDTGAILAQEQVYCDPDLSLSELERQLAERGGHMVVDHLRGWPASLPAARPQVESLATGEPWPDAEDYLVTTNLSARSAYAFLQAVAERAVPASIQTNGGRVPIQRVISWGIGSPPPVKSGETVIQFAEGWLLVEPDSDDWA